MSILEDIRRQQQIRAAEGYLDLVMVCADRWPLRPETRDQIARRALRELSDAVSDDFPSGHVHYLQGQALRVMEKYADAVHPLKIALGLEPENIHIHLALGWCYKRVDRIDLAIQALEEAMDVMPEEGIIHYNLACYWALVDNSLLAVQYLKQSFELDANYREMVATETDFDAIRDDEDFREAVSVIV